MHRKYKMATGAIALALVLAVLAIGWATKDKALAMPAFADVPARILPAAPPEMPVVTQPEKREVPAETTPDPVPAAEDEAAEDNPEPAVDGQVTPPAAAGAPLSGLREAIDKLDELRGAVVDMNTAIAPEDVPARAEETPAATAEQQIDAAWERWQQLNEERDRLQQQLVDVYSEQLALANEIWPAQLERLQQFINDQLGTFSTDIDQWIPPALSEFIATKTGKSVTEWEDYIWGATETDSDIEA